jgi:hypothetical protein
VNSALFNYIRHGEMISFKRAGYRTLILSSTNATLLRARTSLETDLLLVFEIRFLVHSAHKVEILPEDFILG